MRSFRPPRGLLSGFCMILTGAAASAAEPVLPESLPAVDRIGSEATSYVYRMGWDELKPRLKGTQALAVIEDPQVASYLKAIQARGANGGTAGDVYGFVLSAWN